MDSDSLRQTLEHSSIAAIGVGFLAGLAFSFNPVALASIPVSLAYVTKAREKTAALFFGGMFILGVIVTHMMLGLAAGLGGEWVGALLGREWAYVLGPLLILLGLVWTGWLRIPLPRFGFRAKRPTAAWGAFLLGIPFSIAVCPVCTPALIVLLWGCRRSRLSLDRNFFVARVCHRTRNSLSSRRDSYRLVGERALAFTLSACIRNSGRADLDGVRPLFVEYDVLLDSRVSKLTRRSSPCPSCKQTRSLGRGIQSSKWKPQIIIFLHLARLRGMSASHPTTDTID